MCLEVKKTEEGNLPVKTADRDIRCMKVLELYEGVYSTPYMCRRVPDEAVRGEEDFTADRSQPGDYEEESLFGVFEYAEIGAGAIHTFAYTEDSDRAIRGEITFLRRHYCPRATVVFECVIPEGTEYMEGVYDGHKCYGSKSVRFVRELLRITDGGKGAGGQKEPYGEFEENAGLFRET